MITFSLVALDVPDNGDPGTESFCTPDLPCAVGTKLLSFYKEEIINYLFLARPKFEVLIIIEI